MPNQSCRHAGAYVNDVVVYLCVSGFPRDPEYVTAVECVPTVILAYVIPHDRTVIKPRRASFTANQYETMVVVMAVVILDDGVFAPVVAVKAAGVNIARIIYCIAGFVVLYEGVVAVERI